MKYLTFYNKCIKDGKMPHEGLCRCFPSDKKLDLLTPKTVNEFPFYSNPDSIKWAYWAADGEGSGYQSDFKFTPLRENIVLLMAAMNNEL